MSNDITPFGNTGSPFDKIRRIDDNGEHWMDEKLGETFGYTRYEYFQPVVNKAKIACMKSGYLVENHFLDVQVIVNLGSGAKREITRTRLSRYAAYLCALEADSSKKIVAEAKTYFAARTREAELREAQDNELDDDLWQIQQITLKIQENRNELRRLEKEQLEQQQILLDHTARLDSIEGNTEWRTAMAYVTMRNLPDKSEPFCAALSRKAGKIAKANNIEPRKVSHMKWNSVNAYPIWIWDEALAQM